MILSNVERSRSKAAVRQGRPSTVAGGPVLNTANMPLTHPCYTCPMSDVIPVTLLVPDAMQRTYGAEVTIWLPRELASPEEIAAHEAREIQKRSAGVGTPAQHRQVHLDRT